jgi:tryptophan synthase beta chain
LEGILPALEPAHALAKLPAICKDVGRGGVVVMNLCGRGDKDIFTIAETLGASL